MQIEQPIPKWILVTLRAYQTIVHSFFKVPMDYVRHQSSRIAFHLSAHATFDNINLHCLNDNEKEAFFKTAIDALKLLQANDPRRYGRVKKYLENIALLRSGSGHFEWGTSSYIVDSFTQDRPAEFAARILHEATHGMLHGRGFKYEQDRKRHETLCTLEQFRTVRRLINRLNPGLDVEKRAEMVKAWEVWMTTALQDKWWDPHKQRERVVARLISIWNNEKQRSTK